jgi:hypothetical protein
LTGTTVNATTLQQGGVAIDALYVNVSGDTMTGRLTVAGVSGLTDADIPDTITASNYLPLSGGTMTGELSMSGNNISNVGTLIGTTLGDLIISSYGKLIASSEGNNQLVLTTNGRVGIGTTNPSSTLDVKGSTSDNTAAAFNVQNSAETSLLYVRNDGNVGIGITNPETKLHVGGSAKINGSLAIGSSYLTGWPGLFLGNASGVNNTAGVNLITRYQNVLRICPGGSTTAAIAVNDSGNVGIGTTGPGEKLEVNGGIRLNTTTAKPTCDATHRGTLWFTQQEASGSKDALEVCAKDATDNYAWRLLY